MNIQIENPNKIDLKQFIGVDETRIALTEPWNLTDGKVCASDGRILIVCEGSWERSKDLPAPPNVEKILAANQPPADAKWTPVPPLSKLSPTRTCPDCGGTGAHECSCGNVHKCDNCDGTGAARNTESKTKIGPNFYYADHYLAKLQTLPECQVWPTDTGPLCIRFTGGQGLLMSLRV